MRIKWDNRQRVSADGVRVCHPTIGHFGIRIIFSLNQLRNSRYYKSSLLFPILFKVKVHISFCESVSPSIPGRKEWLNLWRHTYHPDTTHDWACITNLYLLVISPCIYSPTIYHPLKPKSLFLCLVTSPLFIALC